MDSKVCTRHLYSRLFLLDKVHYIGETKVRLSRNIQTAIPYNLVKFKTK